MQVTAGSAAIEALSGGTLTFQSHSDGGSAQFIADSGGTIDFSGTLGPNGDDKISAGSLAGAGQIFLGNQQLTIGSNNLSTVVSGPIDGVFGTALVKVGLGTLTLSGNNVLSHITVSAGTLDLASLGGDGGADISLGATPATLQIDNAAIGGGHNFNSTIRFLTNSGGPVIDLPGLPFSSATSVTYNKINSTLVVDNAANQVDFAHWIAQQIQFAALDDHTGGTEIVPAIIESRPGKLVDAKHHPPADQWAALHRRARCQ